MIPTLGTLDAGATANGRRVGSGTVLGTFGGGAEPSGVFLAENPSLDGARPSSARLPGIAGRRRRAGGAVAPVAPAP